MEIRIELCGWEKQNVTNIDLIYFYVCLSPSSCYHIQLITRNLKLEYFFPKTAANNNGEKNSWNLTMIFWNARNNNNISLFCCCLFVTECAINKNIIYSIKQWMGYYYFCVIQFVSRSVGTIQMTTNAWWQKKNKGRRT